MNNTVITVDSGMCAIRKGETKIIPAQLICSNGNSFIDNGEISNCQILNDMQKGKSYKTSSPLLGDFDNTFRSILEQNKDVIHLSMSSGISGGSINGANLIAKQLNEEYKNKVYVIDSLTAATGGTLFYELAYQKLINSNLSTEELVDTLNNLKKQIRTSFYVPNIDGYILSGRDKTNLHSKDNALSITSQIAKKIGLKFRVDFHENGDLVLKNIFRSNQQKGMEKMVIDIVNSKTIENYDKKFVVIGNLFRDKVDMEKIKEYLLSFDYFENILEKEIGSVVAAYGCNDLSGIALMKKLH